MGLDVWNGQVDLWVSVPLATGKPFDSAAGEHCWPERLRQLAGRLREQLIDSGIATRFIVMANRVVLYTARPWNEIDGPLTKVVAEFLGWGSYVREPIIDRRELTAEV